MRTTLAGSTMAVLPLCAWRAIKTDYQEMVNKTKALMSTAEVAEQCCSLPRLAFGQ
jgi:hypothetical protein